MGSADYTARAVALRPPAALTAARTVAGRSQAGSNDVV